MPFRKRAGKIRHHAFRHGASFTLVELLVVIGIIGILAGLILSGVLSAGGQKYVAETRNIISQLAIALENYQVKFADYPPTSLRMLDEVNTTNGKNDGIESVAACLATRDEGFDYDPGKPEYYGNTDNDKIPSGFDNNRKFKTNKAVEIIDSWGNPLVYVRGCEFGSLKSYMKRIRLAEGGTVTIKLPKPDKLTGMLPCESSFIIWSLGPDGKDQQGGGDDVASWK